MVEHKALILVCDDEVDARLHFYQLLSSEGYSVGVCSGGWEAIKEIANLQPDLLVAHIRMPEMDGLELLSRVKHASPKTKVILATAYGDKETRVESLRKGCDGFLQKPFKNAELIEMVRNVLEGVMS